MSSYKNEWLCFGLLICFGSSIFVKECFSYGVRKEVDTVIPQSSVDSVLLLPHLHKGCICWLLCRANSSCLAVSAVSVATGAFECRFSSKAVIATELEPLAGPSHATYYKVCEGPFIWLPSHGSFLFCNLELTFDSASLSCPPNSALAAPSDNATFDKLASYMTDHDLGTNWWVNLRMGNDGKWKWQVGVTSVAEFIPWASWAPNEKPEVTTARMAAPPQYPMDDALPSRKFKFICKLISPGL